MGNNLLNETIVAKFECIIGRNLRVEVNLLDES